MNKVPDAKVIAMINDLSTEGLISLLVLSSPSVEAQLRKAICDEYTAGKLDADTVTMAWDDDRE